MYVLSYDTRKHALVVCDWPCPEVHSLNAGIVWLLASHLCCSVLEMCQGQAWARLVCMPMALPHCPARRSALAFAPLPTRKGTIKQKTKNKLN